MFSDGLYPCAALSERAAAAAQRGRLKGKNRFQTAFCHIVRPACCYIIRRAETQRPSENPFSDGLFKSR
ncbi:hypothetical protein HMPREF9120_00357 [Neisseria sp. oral taxon 020 str. F0370]|nr:hypothetical protein HMPREF9120_00357 [Neisseria sp. oral taxon 020 str. F0370]